MLLPTATHKPRHDREMSVITELRAELISRNALRAHGMSDTRIAAAVRAGELVRVRRGSFITAETWNRQRPEQQHLAQVLAARSGPSLRDSVFSHTSAAVVHGLPLVGALPQRLHVTGASHTRRLPDLSRHVEPLADDDVCLVDGIRVTTLERTAYDLARTLPLPGAVAVVDAALARVGGDPRRFNHTASDELRARLLARAAASDRGVVQARFVLAFANGLASGAIESLGRLRAHELGFRKFHLQVPVPAPDSRMFWVDLRLEEAATWVEFDGFVKLSDERMLTGRTPAQAAREEKEREDWIRGTTGDRLVHFGWNDVYTKAAFASRLRAFRIHLP